MVYSGVCEMAGEVSKTRRNQNAQGLVCNGGSGELLTEFKSRFCSGPSTLPDTVQGVGDTQVTKHTKIPAPTELKL